MKRITILFLIATYCVFNLYSQKVMVLQNGAKTYYSSKIADIQTNLLSGDTLYIPGMVIIESLSFDKTVHIIGAGYHPDSAIVTGNTRLSSILSFNAGSENSSATGIYIDGATYINANNIHISRCNLGNTSIANTSVNPVSQTLFSECILRSPTSGNDRSENTLFRQCILQDNVSNFRVNTLIENCVLTQQDGYASILTSNINLTLKNSIICNPGSPYFLASSAGLIFSNNLFVQGAFAPGTHSLINNVFGVPFDNIFMNFANGDYRLKPTLTQAFTMATDGKQVGIFGTDYPFLVPTFAPRFISIDNSDKLKDGKLSIKMNVEARNR